MRKIRKYEKLPTNFTDKADSEFNYETSFSVFDIRFMVDLIGILHEIDRKLALDFYHTATSVDDKQAYQNVYKWLRNNRDIVSEICENQDCGEYVGSEKGANYCCNAEFMNELFRIINEIAIKKGIIDPEQV